MGLLFENRKQVTAEYLMNKYSSKEAYNSLVKKPSFEITKDRRKIDHVNGGIIKTPKSSMMRASFMATDKTTGLKVEIRYAKSNNSRVVGDRVVDVFEPRYVESNGATFAFQNDIELAAFNFLHPNNSLSPIRSSKGKPKYEYIDTKKRSKDKMDSIDALTDALSHAKNMDEGELVLLAKGLGLKGIDKKEPNEVRADVMEFAKNNPKVYNEKIGTQMTYIKGRIINLIDKGIVRLSTVGSVRRWTWASGEFEGEHILDIQNVTQDAKKALENFFFGDIVKWMSVLANINNDITATEKALRDLERHEQGMKNVIVEPAYVEEKVIGDALPSYLKSPADDFVKAENVKFTREDAIAALTEEGEEPPHHMKVTAWLKKMNAE